MVMDLQNPDAAGGELKKTTTLAHAAEAGPPVLDERSVLRRGDSLGRYMVLEPLGAGGVGVVYAAYDPELDRKVAVKLLRSDLFARSGKRRARSRLRREAQALARLSHPNIVAVYDTGTVDDQVFVAMEFVAGRTLGRWHSEARTRGEPRPWRQVLATFAQAGRGLVAAHAAGVIHRDFKPGNVMIGDDGRVRVLDFGLAISSLPATGGVTPRGAEPPAGTPAYMAPEQAAGAPTDERSDQFSFCCALYEALYGSLPFAGETARDYLARAAAGELREPPVGSNVPARVWRAVARGLDPDPDQRHLSMDALVAELERDPYAGRRRAATAGAVALLIAAGLWWRFQDQPAQLCRGAEARLAGAWDDERRVAVDAAFRASGVGYAADSSREVARLLDAYSRDWAAMYTQACEATHLRGEQSPRLLDLRMSCLDDRRRELAALTDLFAAADAELVKDAVTAAGGLRRLEACADSGLLTSVMPVPDDATAERVATVRQDVARVRALDAAGKYQAGLEEARSADVAAREVDFAPLTAETRFELGELLRERDAYDEAEAGLIEALHYAERGWHEEIRVETLLSLVWLADDRGDVEQGRRWLRVAAGALHRLKEPADLEHRWHHATARIALSAGDYAAATAAARTALAGGEALHGPDYPRVTRYLSTLVLTMMRQGLDAEALPLAERLTEVRRRTLGADHPQTGAADHVLGSVLLRLGRPRRAEPAIRRALATCVSGYGPEHKNVAIVRSDLGALLLQQGRFEEAREEFQRALAIRRATHGAEHMSVAKSLTQLGEAEMHLGRFAEADATLSGALRMKRATAGTRRSTIAYTLVGVGDLMVRWQRYPQAREAYSEARAIIEETLGPEHPLIANVACGLGEAEAGRGRHEQAVAWLEKSFSSAGLREPALRARCGFALARALWSQGRDRQRAFELAAQARDGLEALGRAGQSAHRDLVAWLQAHQPAGGIDGDPREEAGG